MAAKTVPPPFQRGVLYLGEDFIGGFTSRRYTSPALSHPGCSSCWVSLFMKAVQKKRRQPGCGKGEVRTLMHIGLAHLGGGKRGCPWPPSPGLGPPLPGPRAAPSEPPAPPPGSEKILNCEPMGGKLINTIFRVWGVYKYEVKNVCNNER